MLAKALTWAVVGLDGALVNVHIGPDLAVGRPIRARSHARADRRGR